MSMKRKFSGIKARAIIYIVTPVIVSFTVICCILFIMLFNSQQNIVMNDFQDIVNRHSRIFENKINKALDYLSFTANVLEFQVINGNTDREALQKFLFAVFNDHPGIDGSSIYFESDMYDGKDAEYTDTEYGTASSGRICFYYYRENGLTAYIPEAIGNDLEFSQSHYLDTKTLNTPIYSNPAVYTIDGEDVFLFVISYPIRGENNEFIGAITADIHLKDIHSLLQSEEIYKSGFIIISNDKGRLIYSPRF